MNSYKGWRVEKGKRIGDPVEVEAKNTNQAGERCAKEFERLGFVGIDPFTIDLEEQIAQNDAASMGLPWGEEDRQVVKDAVSNAVQTTNRQKLLHVNVNGMVFALPLTNKLLKVCDVLRPYVPDIDGKKLVSSRPLANGDVEWVLK